MNASPEKELHRREKHPASGDFFEDIFLIPAKNASLEALKRWRKFTLVLNAARRFRYTANLKAKKFKTGTHVVVAARRFRIAGDAAAQRKALHSLDEPPIDNFRIGPKKLQHLVQHHDAAELEQLGGVSGIAKLLNTSVEKGIPNEKQEIERRRNGFGENTYPRKPYKGFFSFLWEAFQDKTLIILMICAALSLAFGIKSDGIKEGWYDGTSIAFAVILVVLVTAISDYRQSLQFQSLDEEKRNIHLDVIRGGRRFPVSIYDLVVGDVVPLNIGDQVPADGLLLAGHSLSVDESSMTGESELVHVDNKDPFLISGCKIADGYGTMVVTAVGTNTEWGQLMASISDDTTEETPLQVRLNGVATFIGKIGLIVALLVFIILTVFYFTGHTSGSKNGQKFKAGKTKADDAVNSMVDIFAIAVTIIVVAVPEGLPLAVTLTLAYSMRKMMADKALVRRLAACETMGSATAICSDKTGTLTLNQMTVVKAWVSGEMREPCVRLDMLKENIHSLLHEGISQNSTGGVYIPEEGDEVEVTGSPTEKALLSWGLQSGMDFEKARSRSQILQVETFSSEKKRAGVAVQVADSGEIHLHWKGAAEIVLSSCDSWLNTEGMIVPMTEEKKEELRNTIGGMAAASLRCVAFAYRTLHREEKPDGDEWTNWKILETNLSLIAIVGIKDPCRPGVQEAVRLCQAAGVKVRMVTGDNILTARAIAAECGILQEGDLTVEGATFRGYTPEKRIENLPKIAVMARSSPSDKLLMVKTLRELGHVVGVTGDGTNDAPALNEADIGLAMGIQGTEVAKESSDIIILDDNFSSVVNVVRWGRSVYFNIQKFVQFQLTVNVAALVINFVAAVTSGRVPLTAVQLLWVNLIMDTLGALALATEPPTNELMHKPPVGRNSPLITNIMWRNLLAQALFQVAVLLTLEFRGKQLLHLKGPNATTVKDTVIFNTFVFCQIFNEINARKPEELNIFKGILRNKMFVTIIVSEVILQIMIVEFLKKFASTTKLNWQQWLICLVIAFITWPIGFIVKFIPVPRKQVSLNLNCWRRRKGSQEKECS